MPAGCLALFFITVFLALVPLFMANVAMTALGRLGLTPEVSFLIFFGVIAGGMFNIPVKRMEHPREIEFEPRQMFGFGRFFSGPPRHRTFTLIALNVGGGLIPSLLATYQIMRITARGPGPFLAVLIAVSINISVCYHIAKPIPGKGIAMPPLIPGLVAALSGVLLLSDFAPPLAFAAGVMGPLIGADLLHLKDLTKSPTGIASIGGAGTFDGIVISGLVALLLA